MELEFTATYQKLVIDCEIANINFYAQEIGFFKKILEKEENDTASQWFNFFKNYSNIELEQAHERLEQLRAGLTEWESLQRPEENRQPVNF